MDDRLVHSAPLGRCAKPCCVPSNPRGGPIEATYDPHQPTTPIPRKVVKGGSFLCAPNYCQRYRPAARQPQMIDSAMSHMDFAVSSEAAAVSGLPRDALRHHKIATRPKTPIRMSKLATVIAIGRMAL